MVAREEQILIKPADYCNASILIGENEICAGTDDIDITRGDGDGPLMPIKNGKWYQHGVLSKQIKSAASVHHRDIYIDYTKFCIWIEQTTKDDVKCGNDKTFK